MTTDQQRKQLRSLEGRTIHVSLRNGSRLDYVSLVSARGRSVWIFAAGEDAFLALADIVDVWEAEPVRVAA